MSIVRLRAGATISSSSSLTVTRSPLGSANPRTMSSTSTLATVPACGVCGLAISASTSRGRVPASSSRARVSGRSSGASAGSSVPNAAGSSARVTRS
jgi:hypothetical protein